MSSGTAPDKTSPGSDYRRPPAEETAPSPVAGEEFTFPRVIGMAGMVFAIIGSLFMFVSMARDVPVRVLYLLAVGLGLAMMLYHAARDGAEQVRRSYGMFGVGLLVLGGIFALLPGGPESEMGYRFLSVGFPSLLLGLLFIISFAKHETDEQYRWYTLLLLLAVGVLLAGFTFITGLINPDFMAGTGVLMSLLGLAFLCSYIANVGSATGAGFRVAIGMGIAGAVVTIYALGRAIIPDLFGMTDVSPFLVPSGLILIGLGLIYMFVSLAMWTDNQFMVLTRRELMAYFCSPIAYLVLLGVALMGWLNYWSFLELIMGRVAEGQLVPEPIVGWYILRLESVMAVLFVVPAITMRLFSEERRTGTLEVLLTAPVSEWVVVLSKFTASFIFFMILWLPWGLYLVALRSEGGQPFDYRPLLSFFLVLAVTGGSFLSIGVFFSSLTRNQIVAGVLTFLVMLVSFVLFFVDDFTGIGAQWKAVFKKLSFLEQWQSALGGKLLVRDMILHLSLTVFWLFLTTKVLESRKWK